jgi:hypothetical protein
MKFAALKSIGHNIADSLASGIGLPIGPFMTDVCAEAARSSTGYITVDFLAGRANEGETSDALQEAITRYGEYLPKLCTSHGADVRAFKTLTARFGVDRVYGYHFAVTVEDQNGKRSDDQYVGRPGKRWRRGH